ncbi:hypothetical protein GW17_00003325 [Ensete ventricosum]|nr:hypothetical protein GW17_00003325 [Ensete ventricosum]
MGEQRYSRLGRRWRTRRGFRLGSNRFAVPLLRDRLCTLWSLFSRCLHVVKRGLRRNASRWPSSSSGSRRGFVSVGRHGGQIEGRLRSCGGSNSFYTEAIADCLEFIKRSSMSATEVSTVPGRTTSECPVIIVYRIPTMVDRTIGEGKNAEMEQPIVFSFPSRLAWQSAEPAQTHLTLTSFPETSGAINLV